MSVRAIAKSEFEAHHPVRGPLASSFPEEREWFADDSDTLLGALLWNRVKHEWALVVLGRDERGMFRAIETDVFITDEETARARLIGAMNRAAKMGQVVFRQGD